MNPTKVVNIRDGVPEGSVYIGRAGRHDPGYFGNPFKITERTTRESILAQYREYAQRRISLDPEFASRVRGLYGKTLVCFCAPKLCHGDVLAELAEELYFDWLNGYQ